MNTFAYVLDYFLSFGLTRVVFSNSTLHFISVSKAAAPLCIIGAAVLFIYNSEKQLKLQNY
jgi:hypothetical protein